MESTKTTLEALVKKLFEENMVRIGGWVVFSNGRDYKLLTPESYQFTLDGLEAAVSAIKSLML